MHYQAVTSEAVLAELEAGDFPGRDDAIELIDGLTMLELTDAVRDTAAVHIDRRVMPADPYGDALHLAIASVHRCRYLLTWNCRHIANANKFDNIARINALLNLPVPLLVTPDQLMFDDH